MDRHGQYAADDDPFVRKLQGMSCRELLKFFSELISVNPASRYRKDDTRLAGREILRRMHRNYCLCRKIRHATVPRGRAVDPRTD
jgi:hypothetical protein